MATLNYTLLQKYIFLNTNAKVYFSYMKVSVCFFYLFYECFVCFPLNKMIFFPNNSVKLKK